MRMKLGPTHWEVIIRVIRGDREREAGENCVWCITICAIQEIKEDDGRNM